MKVLTLVLGIVLIAVGIVGIILAGEMFGDIGITAGIGAITAILSGIGFLICANHFRYFKINNK